MWGTLSASTSQAAQGVIKQMMMRCPYLLANPSLMSLAHSSVAGGAMPDNLRNLARKCPVLAPTFNASAAETTPTPESKCPVMNGVQAAPAAPAPSKCPFVHAKTDATAAPVATYDMSAHFDRELDQKKKDASYRYFNCITRKAAVPAHGHRHKINTLEEAFSATNHHANTAVWCSNDYLGMSHNPVVVDAVDKCLKLNGLGAGGTRNISGNNAYHLLLEKELADLHQKEAALLFSSGYVANDASLATLGSRLPGCIFFSDASNHASMIEGMRHSRAARVVFEHNSPEHLERLLQQADPSKPKIVAFESVYSMCGSIAPIGEMCDIAHKYGALTFVDEVHAVGLYGLRGAGVGEVQGVLDKMDVISGTLGKAFGSYGGYIAGNANLVDYVRSFASGFIFTTSLPPPVVAGSIASVQFLKEHNEVRVMHQLRVQQVKSRLRAKGFPLVPSVSHIVPVLVGDAAKARKISDLLLNKHNIYVQSINYPTVPRGTERLRITPGPHHTEEMIDNLVDALTSAWEEAGLSLQPQQQKEQDQQQQPRQQKEKAVMMAGWEKLMPLSMQQVQQASLNLKA